jgi:hypothetical protein
MAKYYLGQGSLTTGYEVYDFITTALTDAGWTNLGSGSWQIQAGTRTSLVYLPISQWLSTTPYIQLNGVTAYFPTHQLVVGSILYYMISVDTDFFYVRVQGPNVGGTGVVDATYGSPRAFAMLTTVTPADSFDTDADGLQVVLRSHGTSATTFNTVNVTQKFGPTGTANAAAELVCTRPAIQDIVTVGDLPPSNRAGSGYFGSRYGLVDSGFGLRGTLNNVAFGCENYVLAGDNSNNQFAIESEYTHAGDVYVVDVPCGAPNAGGTLSYSPLGLCATSTNQVNSASSPNVCGPRIFVKKGDGS